MQLILFRHGIAEDVSVDGSDEKRELTREGIERTTQAAAGLSRIIDKPSLIVTSPKIRARQTADLVARACKSASPQVEDVIACESATRIVQFILQCETKLLIVVGHEPTLSHAAAQLCTGDQTLDLFNLKKAGAIAIEIPDGQRSATIAGELLWCLPPTVLRTLAK